MHQAASCLRLRAGRFNDLDSVSRLTSEQAISAGNASADLIKTCHLVSWYHCNVFVLVHGDAIAMLYTFAAVAILAKVIVIHYRIIVCRGASISSRERPWHHLVPSSRR
jgi:hypothetical protein